MRNAVAKKNTGFHWGDDGNFFVGRPSESYKSSSIQQEMQEVL